MMNLDFFRVLGPCLVFHKVQKDNNSDYSAGFKPIFSNPERNPTKVCLTTMTNYQHLLQETTSLLNLLHPLASDQQKLTKSTVDTAIFAYMFGLVPH